MYKTRIYNNHTCNYKNGFQNLGDMVILLIYAMFRITKDIKRNLSPFKQGYLFKNRKKGLISFDSHLAFKEYDLEHCD